MCIRDRQYNRRILNGENTCHVYAIQESNSINRAHLKYFGAGMDDIEKNLSLIHIFLTGIGKCYPILRSHKVLNNLHQAFVRCGRDVLSGNL